MPFTQSGLYKSLRLTDNAAMPQESVRFWILKCLLSKQGNSNSQPGPFLKTLFLGLGIFIFSFASLAKEEPSESKAPEIYPADLLQISNTEAFSKFVFLVDKTQRKLLVYQHDGETIQKIDELPADIGKNGGNKTRRDDHKTPEGIYFFQKRMVPPEIPFDVYGKMAFVLNYPNLFDLHEKKTGSGIWLHSIPDTVPLTRGSRGCVVVRNEMIQKIADYIKLNETPVVIYDHIEYIPKPEHDRRRKELGDYLKSWKEAWESRDVEKYMKFYSSDFSAPGGFNFRSWQNHKQRLKDKYKFIKITLSQPFLLLHKDQLIVKTLQRYESDEHVDYGVKTLHALKTAEGYKILREDWVPSKEDGSTSGETLKPADLTSATTEESKNLKN